MKSNIQNKVSHAAFECLCNLHKRFERDFLFCPFNITNIISRQVSLLRQLLLTEPGLLSPDTDGFSQNAIDSARRRLHSFQSNQNIKNELPTIGWYFTQFNTCNFRADYPKISMLEDRAVALIGSMKQCEGKSLYQKSTPRIHQGSFTADQIKSMKTHSRSSLIVAAILSVACVSSGFAQTLSIQPSSFVETTQPAQPDSIVQIAAESQGLEQIAPTDLPIVGGTFWWVMPGGAAVPAPCAPLDLSEAIYRIADGQFLVDETGGQVVANTPRFGLQAQAASSIADSEVASQVDAVVNLITQVQAKAANQQMRTMALAMGMDIPFPGGDGSGDGGDGPLPMFSSSYSIDTNSLWLEITNVANGGSYLNLHNGTNQVYAIWSTTNLSIPFSNWQVEREVWPTDTNCTPFTVQTQDRQNLFMRAEDWTVVDSNGDGIPDWWIWLYFGNLNETATNLDSQGITLLNDYQNGLDPNVISFTLSYTNQYAPVSGAPVQVNVTAGAPSFFAVLVDNTNFTGATWNAYTSSNLIINLGTTQGWHDVWVGLKGLPPDATQTWRWDHLNLALPPLLVITNPVTTGVSQPIIQIYGYCQESLASISYDISNAVGVITNQPSEITDRYYDTNVWGFTTNFFECLDVPLTNGLNAITIHATDLAGNITTTNFNFTLDYSNKTNPPVVQITWPQAGTQIGGSNFTCRGWIDDPTAIVTTQLVFTNANTNLFWGGIYTNVYMGSVERNGTFWLENLPMTAGTNSYTITIRDAAGNTTVTNISAVQSALVLTINPVGDNSQLWQTTVYLTGTISDPTYAIWVNGVKGHNNGNGTWSANNVPINNGGTASFTATAYAPTEQQPDGSYGN
jgi:hypothetical protein